VDGVAVCVCRIQRPCALPLLMGRAAWSGWGGGVRQGLLGFLNMYWTFLMLKNARKLFGPTRDLQ
jgi:hypothetical protein